MENTLLTVQMGPEEALTATTALIALVQDINEGLPALIALEGEGTGRTLAALSVKMTALCMMRGFMEALGVPAEVIAAQVRELVENSDE